MRSKHLILVLSLLATCLSVMAQSISLKLTNVPVKSAMAQIEKQSPYSFVYKVGDVNTDKTVSVNATTLTDALNQIFQGQDVSYDIQGNKIVVTKGKVKASQPGSKRNIAGMVVDDKGAPVPGASVMIPGSSTGTVTGIDGHYSLEVPSGTMSLEVSSLGYATVQVTIGHSGTYNVTLEEDTTALDEVIVIGYGTSKRKDFTGSVTSVKLEETPAALTNNTNALEDLKGKVGGLDIGATTSAGGEPSMQVRGQNSLSGSNNPLIVVDGVIFMGSINDISPSDIASIDVLKDATSAAAYGSRSANGVIIITTKKGKTDKPTIYLNASSSLQRWHMMPELMDGEQWRESIRVANGYPDYSFITRQEQMNVDSGKQYNWLDEISRIGVLQDYQVAVSGTSNKMNYYLSTSYTDSQGVIKGDDFNRISVFGKISSDITDWLRIGLDAAYTRRDYSGNAANVYNAMIMSPYGMKNRPNGELEYSPVANSSRVNPLWTLDESRYENLDKRDNLRANTYMVVKIPWITGLSYRLNFSRNMNWRDTGSFTHESAIVQLGEYDDDSRYSLSTQSQYLSSANGSLGYRKTDSYVIDNILNYNNSFAKHNIDLTAVATRDSQWERYREMSGSNFAANGNTSLGLYGLHYATTQQISLSNWKQNNIGYFGRASWSYDDRYYLTASYRRDGSSVFGADRKWGDFYAFGGAWRITNEAFMNNKGLLNDLKLKLSWGRNGNQGLSRYSTLSKVSNGKSGGIFYVFDHSSQASYGISQSTIGNTDLGWETTEAWNSGFESAWFDNRLFVDIDVYFSRTFDQIFQRKIPVMTGFGNIYSSMGEVSNKGFELNVRSINIKNSDFQWTTDLVAWFNRDKLVHLYGEDLDGDGIEDSDEAQGLFIGESIHSIFGYKQDGIVQTSDTEYMAANGVAAGTPKYVDVNGDGKITNDDRIIIGNTYPGFKLNLANTLRYRNWELYAMIAGVFGGGGYYQKSNSGYYITGGDRAMFASNGVYTPYWTESNPSNEFPSATFISDSRFLGLQSRTFVRLQDVTLSYTFNQPWIKNAKISNLKLFLTGKNLFTLTKWKGEPETGNVAESSSYPIMSSLSLGANLSF